jgi:hypothetical protein
VHKNSLKYYPGLSSYDKKDPIDWYSWSLWNW